MVIAGPHHLRKRITGSTSLKLAGGVYTLSAGPVEASAGAYYATAPQEHSHLRAGHVTTVIVSYATLVPKTTSVVPTLDTASLTGEPSGPRVLRLAGAAARSAKVGETLASGSTAAAPDGYLVKVVKIVQKSSGATVLDVENTTLPQALPSGEIAAEDTLEPPAGAASPNGGGALGLTLGLAHGGSRSAHVAGFSLHATNLTCTTSAGVHINSPTVSFTPSIALHAHWGFFKLDSASFAATVAASLAMGANAEAGASCETNDPGIGLLAHPISLPDIDVQVGPIPVVITPRLQVYLSGKASITAKVSVSIEQSASATVGVSYEHGRFSPIDSFPEHFKQSFTSEGDAAAELALTPTVDTLIYGITGPSFDIGAAAKFDADVHKTPWWTLEGCLEAGLGFVVGPLGLNWSDPHLIQLCKTLLKAIGGPPSSSGAPGGGGSGGGSGSGGGESNPPGGGTGPSGGGGELLEGGITSLQSVDAEGTSDGNANSDPGGMSSDGRYVVFDSQATNLTTAATHGYTQVYERDRVTGVTTLVSVSQTSGGGGGDCDSDVYPFGHSAVSSDGRYVVFSSCATDLTSLPTNGDVQIYERDMLTGTTELISANAADTAGGNGPSGDETYGLEGYAVSAEGGYVVFSSYATDLTATAPASEAPVVYERDTQIHTTSIVSGNGEICYYFLPGGIPQYDTGPVAVSSDGRYVAFGVCEPGGSLQRLYERDMQTRELRLINVGLDTEPDGVRDGEPASVDWYNLEDYHGPMAISPDGSRVFFESWDEYHLTGGEDSPVYGMKIFERNLLTGTTSLVIDPTEQGAECSAVGFAVSANTRYLAYGLSCGNTQAMQVRERDLQTGHEALVSVDLSGEGGGNCESFPSAVSEDGNVILFGSCATDLLSTPVSNENVYVRAAPVSPG